MEAKREIDDLKLKLEHGKIRICTLTARKHDNMARGSLISYIEESMLHPRSLTDVEKAAIFEMSPDVLRRHLEVKYKSNKDIVRLNAYRRGAKKYIDVLKKSKAGEKVVFYQRRLRI